MKRACLSILITLCLGAQAMAEGAYIEFKMSGTGSGNGITGTTKVYSSDGNTRSEVVLSSPQMPGGGITRVALILKDKPNTLYNLNETGKTYSETDITKNAAADEDASQWEVTVVGKEKVNGYNSTHVKVKKTGGTNEQELWVSTDLPNFKQFLNVKSKYTSRGLAAALSAKGAEGFPVRVLAAEHGSTIQIDLVKAEVRANPASLFSLDGYKKEGAAPASGPSGMPADLQEMQKKIQNMTPEERKKFIEQLKQQQQQNPPPSSNPR